jgi:hypothetical protein
MPRPTSQPRGAKTAHGRLVVVSRSIVEQGSPANRVFHFAEDDGYVILDQATADQDPGLAARDSLEVVCLECLLELQPEVGRGLDVARGSESGGARLYRGEWLEEME